MSDAQDRGWGPPCPDESDLVNIRPGGLSRDLKVHKRVAPIFTAFIDELVARGYPVEASLRDDWGYKCKHINDDPSKPFSNHAWGLAVDVNAVQNPRKSPLTTNLPDWVRQAGPLMDTYGLRWGGAFTGTPDPMHFEFMLTPADADRIGGQLAAGLSMAEAQGILKRLEAIFDALRDGSDTNLNSLKSIRGHVVAIEGDVKELRDEVMKLRDAHPRG